MMQILQLIDLEKSYSKAKNESSSPSFTLKSINLTIEDGEFFALLGPSGCGKTTLLKLVAGLIEPDKGNIILGMTTLNHLPAEKRGFGMVFQQPLLFPHMSVEDNVAFGLKMQGIGKVDRLKAARQMLIDVGLENYGSRYPAELSGGQQQRVSLARAMIVRPKLLLMDEPFTSLDPGLRGEMMELVKQIHHKYKTTIIFVTHDRGEAFLLADRIAVMQDGRILQTGKPQELYEHPNSPDVAWFLGVKNVLVGEVKQGDFQSGQFNVILEQEHANKTQSGWLVLRPESLNIMMVSSHLPPAILESDSPSDVYPSAAFMRTIRGMVKETAFRQGFYYMKVEVGSVFLEVVEKSGSLSLPHTGDQIEVRFDIRQSHFIPGDY